MNKILIVEDDQTISMGLEYYLTQEGFNITVVSTFNKAMNEFINNNFDLAILDLSLPDGNGFDLYKEFKKLEDVPIIFLTAIDDEVSIVMGLDMGADDYITKPFKARELLSRIKNVLRRSKNTYVDFNIIKIKDVVIDIKQAKVTKGGKDVFLTALEYKILLILALNPNQVFTREQILADIWDVNEEYVNDNTLTVYIKRLREKIETDKNNPLIIETVRGIGYKVVIE